MPRRHLVVVVRVVLVRVLVVVVLELVEVVVRVVVVAVVAVELAHGAPLVGVPRRVVVVRIGLVLTQLAH